MNCQQARPLIDPYADGELEAAAILDLEQHLQGCPSCSLAWRNSQALKKTLRNDSFYFTAPENLRRKLNAGLQSQIKPETSWSFLNWKWLTAGTTTVALASLALLLTVTLMRPSPEEQLAQEVVSSHIRSLMAGHALDVTSTDQHTVKPWFNGKLDFSPPVRDLAAQEFPLVGGRLDYLDGRSVAALVFQRHKHVINLFIWPAKENASKPLSSAPIHGYNVIHWSGAEMVFWAVSDLNENELIEFARDYSESLLPSPSPK